MWNECTGDAGLAREPSRGHSAGNYPQEIGNRVTMTRLFALLLGLVLAAPLQAQAPKLHMLSKADAAAVFAMSSDQWQANIDAAVENGVAQPVGSPGEGPFGMAMRNPQGDLLAVSAAYPQGPEAPAFVQVTVGYSGARAEAIGPKDVARLLMATEQSMAPEFAVLGRHDEVDNGLTIQIVIRRK